MTTFDERERAFEKAYANKQEQAFRILSRRNWLFGQDVAKRMGRGEEDADAYAHQTMMSYLDHRHEMTLLDNARRDIANSGKEASLEELQKALDACDAQAQAETILD